MKRVPLILVDDERFTRTAYVCFAGDELIGWNIPADWVDQLIADRQYTADELGEDAELTNRDEAESYLIDEFFKRNTEVERYWPRSGGGLLLAGGLFYKYYDDGRVQFLRRRK